MSPEHYGVIYRFIFPNDKFYIGQSIRFEQRMREHAAEAGKKRPKSLVGRAIKKYGWENIIIEVIVTESDSNMLNYSEKFFVQTHESTNQMFGYNVRDGGNAASGWYHSATTKLKQSLLMKGKKHTEEHNLKISLGGRGKKRPPFSDEHREKIGLSKKGKRVPPRSDEYRLKQSVAQTGRVHSEATKEKISSANTGKILSEEHKEKISAANKGKSFSEEHKQKMSNSSSKKRTVIQLSSQGELVTEYTSLTAAALATDIQVTSICQCCKGKLKHAGGFQWQYSTIIPMMEMIINKEQETPI